MGVNFVLYLWGFPQFRNVLSGSSCQLIGLDVGAHTHLWHTLRWQLAIFFVAVLQLLALQFSRLARSRTVSQSNPAFSPGRFISHLLGWSWSFVSLVTLLLCGVLGRVTLIKAGFILFMFLLLLTFRTRFMRFHRLLWNLCMAYAGLAFLMQYIFQFDKVNVLVGNHLSTKWQQAIELRIESKQLNLFIYLVC